MPEAIARFLLFPLRLRRAPVPPLLLRPLRAGQRHGCVAAVAAFGRRAVRLLRPLAGAVLVDRADAYRQLNLEKIKGGTRQDLVRGYVGLGLWLEPQLDVGAAADGAGAAAPAAAAAAAAADGSGGGGAAAASGEPSAAAAGEDETKSGAS